MEEFLNIHLNGQLYLYMSKIVNKQDYNIYYSDVIDDEYWNFAYLKKNDVSLKKIFEDVKLDMKSLNRMPVIYISSDIMNVKLEEEVRNLELKLLYTDVWMTLNDLEHFAKYKSKIDFSICKVNAALNNQFIQAVLDGFSGDDPEDPYGTLSDGYRIALEKSFKENDSEYKVIHYLGRKDQESISTATVVYRRDKAIIYNVTTNKKYQKNGVCKQMMSDIIQDLAKIGIEEVCLQTEQGYYTEQVYKNMGFAEKMLGKTYIEKE